jgi:hypothetical protein
MRIQNQLGLMKHFTSQEGTASMLSTKFVSDDPGFQDCAQLAEVLSDVGVIPVFGYLTNKKPHINVGPFF